MDHAAVETARTQQFELDASVAGKRRVAAADDDWVDEQVVLVDEAGPDRLSGEVRPSDADVTLGLRLEPPDRVGIELPLEPGLRARDVAERPREDDLLGAPPDLRVITDLRRLIGARGLPIDHRLVH